MGNYKKYKIKNLYDNKMDYVDNPDNEGEMMFAFYNLSEETVVIEKGEKLGQGIFSHYGITDDDNAEGERIGGFGSTGK